MREVPAWSGADSQRTNNAQKTLYQVILVPCPAPHSFRARVLEIWGGEGGANCWLSMCNTFKHRLLIKIEGDEKPARIQEHVKVPVAAILDTVRRLTQQQKITDSLTSMDPLNSSAMAFVLGLPQRSGLSRQMSRNATSSTPRTRHLPA